MRTLPIVALACLVTACTSPSPAATPSTVTAQPTQNAAAERAQKIAHYIDAYGGARGAYLAIYAETDCGMLDKELATAQANNTLGFELAVYDREEELHCH